MERLYVLPNIIYLIKGPLVEKTLLFLIPLLQMNTQSASVNRAILQHCFFLVQQHWGGCRYRHFVANFKAF